MRSSSLSAGAASGSAGSAWRRRRWRAAVRGRGDGREEWRARSRAAPRCRRRVSPWRTSGSAVPESAARGGAPGRAQGPLLASARLASSSGGSGSSARSARRRAPPRRRRGRLGAERHLEVLEERLGEVLPALRVDLGELDADARGAPGAVVALAHPGDDARALHGLPLLADHELEHQANAERRRIGVLDEHPGRRHVRGEAVLVGDGAFEVEPHHRVERHAGGALERDRWRRFRASPSFPLRLTPAASPSRIRRRRARWRGRRRRRRRPDPRPGGPCRRRARRGSSRGRRSGRGSSSRVRRG